MFTYEKHFLNFHSVTLNASETISPGTSLLGPMDNLMAGFQTDRFARARSEKRMEIRHRS